MLCWKNMNICCFVCQIPEHMTDLLSCGLWVIIFMDVFSKMFSMNLRNWNLNFLNSVIYSSLTFIWMYGLNLCDFSAPEDNLGIDLFADISCWTQKYKQVVKLISWHYIFVPTQELVMLLSMLMLMVVETL